MLSLTFMERENSKTNCCVVSVEVLYSDKEDLFKLPSRVHKTKPFTTESAGNQQDVEKWQYLPHW